MVKTLSFTQHPKQHSVLEGQASPQEKRNPIVSRIGWFLLAYLLVGILLVNLLVLLGQIETYDIIQKLDFAVYAITAAMMAVARKSFRDFRIDRLSIILFIVFGTVLRIPPPSAVASAIDPTYYAFGLIALVLAVVVHRSRKIRGRWASTDWRWLVMGAFSGLVLVPVFAILGPLFSGESIRLRPAWPITTGALFLTFIYQMGHTAILEEPVFRGFLWGYLEQRRWHPAYIWQLQAALFWIAHLRYYERPFTLWVALPVGGLLFGWLSWKSRSISASLLAHAVYNTVGAFF